MRAPSSLRVCRQDKFGLSPINVDRVDLQRFPQMVNAPPLVAHMSAGDSLYLPDGWWHVVFSHPGRNVAVALEMHPFIGEMELWPPETIRMRNSPGLYWAETTRIQGTMRDLLGERFRSRATKKPFVCEVLAEVPKLASSPHLGSELGGH